MAEWLTRVATVFYGQISELHIHCGMWKALKAYETFDVQAFLQNAPLLEHLRNHCGEQMTLAMELLFWQYVPYESVFPFEEDMKVWLYKDVMKKETLIAKGKQKMQDTTNAFLLKECAQMDIDEETKALCFVFSLWLENPATFAALRSSFNMLKRKVEEHQNDNKAFAARINKLILFAFVLNSKDE
jgi:hypothetical protein